MPYKVGERVKQYLVVALALLAVVIAYFRFVHDGTKPSEKIGSPPPKVVASKTYAIKKQRPQSIEKTVYALNKYKRTEIKDIFMPPTFPEPAQASARASAEVVEPRPEPTVTLELKGTIIGNSQPMAIINDKFVRIGEKVGDYEVVDITENTAYLKSGAHKKRIQMLTPLN